MLAQSIRLGAIVFVGNDEFAHRKYACDFRRTYEIASFIGASPMLSSLPLVYVRFNPHYRKNRGVYYDTDLKTAHEILLNTIRGLERKDLKNTHGVNLVYVHYDTTEDGELMAFDDEPSDSIAPRGGDEGEIAPGMSYADLYRNAVIKIVY